jgi:hypothetical protein
MLPWKRFALAVASLAAVAAAADDEEREVVELIPDDRASFSAGDLLSPVTSFFKGGPGYWYGERTLDIDTTPPGAVLDLFYVRQNFQKRFEQAEAPATVILPSRSEAGERDIVTVRALLDGFRQREVKVKVRSDEQTLVIDLEPLPNSLVALTQVYFAGRASLTFLTDEALTFRLQKAPEGLSVVLTGTALGSDADETLEGVTSTLVEGVKAQQLGEDLVVRVALAQAVRDGKVDTRSRQSMDPVRGLHSFALDLVPPDGGAAAVERAKAALASIGRSSVSGCASVFDTTLREELDPAALSRALAASGSFVDPYLRAAMKRLGEVSPDGVVELVDGSKYRPAIPIELMAAGTEAAQVKGYLAMLRAFVDAMEAPEHRRSTLRGLVAPELGTVRFGSLIDEAESREQRCLAGASPPPAA